MNQPHSNGSQRVKVVRIIGSVSSDDFTHVSHTLPCNICASQALDLDSSLTLVSDSSQTFIIMAVPRPSSAPQESVEDPISSPYYSPVPSPEAETVNSSSSAQSPCSPVDLSYLEPLEAFETFKEHMEMSAPDTNK
eukprot:5327947-Amphidinium_carterae.1